MKKILSLINVFAICLLVACNPNDHAKFNDKDAFAAFDGSSYSISERGGSLKIPVTLASVKGLNATVTVKGIDGTAKAGENYNITNSSLVFDATNRTAYVEVQIINKAEVFTGDLNFKITFDNLGEVNAGYNSSVSVTINDEDHPLSMILGTYTATGTKYGAGEVSFQMELKKDATDITKVWFYDIMGNPGWAGDDVMYYGVVNSEKTQIDLPLGQESEYKYSGTTPISLFGLYVSDGDLFLEDDATKHIRVLISNGGANLKFTYDEPLIGYAAYIVNAGSVGMYISEIQLVKND